MEPNKTTEPKNKITPKKIKCFIWTVLNTLHVQISNFLRPMNDGRRTSIHQPAHHFHYTDYQFGKRAMSNYHFFFFFFSVKNRISIFVFHVFCFGSIWKLPHIANITHIIVFPKSSPKKKKMQFNVYPTGESVEPKIHKTKPNIKMWILLRNSYK